MANGFSPTGPGGTGGDEQTTTGEDEDDQQPDEDTQATTTTPVGEGLASQGTSTGTTVSDSGQEQQQDDVDSGTSTVDTTTGAGGGLTPAGPSPGGTTPSPETPSEAPDDSTVETDRDTTTENGSATVAGEEPTRTETAPADTDDREIVAEATEVRVGGETVQTEEFQVSGPVTGERGITDVAPGRVTERGDTPSTQAAATEQGVETLDSELGRQARQLEAQIVQEYANIDEPSDIRITVEGENTATPSFGVELTETGRRDIAQGAAVQTALQTEGFDVGDIQGQVSDGSVSVEATPEARRRRAREQAAARSERFTPDDFTATINEQGEVEVSLNESGRAKVREDRSQLFDQGVGFTRAGQVGTQTQEGEFAPVVKTSSGAGDDTPFREMGFQSFGEREVVTQDARDVVAGQAADVEAALGIDIDGDGDIAFRQDVTGATDETPFLQAGVQRGAVDNLVNPSERAAAFARAQQAARRRTLRSRVSERTGLEAGEGFTIQETPAGLAATLTAEGQRELAQERVERRISQRTGLDESDVRVDLQRRSEREQIAGLQRERQSPVDTGGTGAFDVSLSQGTQQALIRQQVEEQSELEGDEFTVQRDASTGEFDVVVRDEEEFGDFQLQIPGTDATLERAVEDLAGIYSQEVTPRAAAVGGAVGAGLDDISDFQEGVVLDALGRDDAEVTESTGLENLGRGIGRGAAELFNAPAYLRTIDEGLETAAFGGEEIAAGRGEEFATELGAAGFERGTQIARTAQERPLETSGTLIGGALIAGGLVRTASRFGGAQAARTTAAVVDPAEFAARGLFSGARGTLSAVSTPSLRSRTDIGSLRTGTRGQRQIQIQRTRTRGETEAQTDVSGDISPSDFESQAEFRREIRRRIAREELPPRSEFESEDVYLRELEARAERLSDERVEQAVRFELAAEQLPPASEFQSAAEFGRELELRMQRVELEDTGTRQATVEQTQQLEQELLSAGSFAGGRSSLAVQGIVDEDPDAEIDQEQLAAAPFASQPGQQASVVDDQPQAEQELAQKSVQGTGQDAESLQLFQTNQAFADSFALTRGLTLTESEQLAGLQSDLASEQVSLQETEQLFDFPGLTIQDADQIQDQQQLQISESLTRSLQDTETRLKTDSRRRLRTFDFDLGLGPDDEDGFGFDPGSGDVLTDFIDPLSGGELETSSGPFELLGEQ